MTPKQERFVQEYLVDLNATQAYKRAGYSVKGAGAAVNACRLLANANIAKAIQCAKLAREEATKISAQYVLRGAAELFERCMQKVPVMVYDRESRCMVHVTEEVLDRNSGELREEGVWKFDSSGAAAALNILGKHVDIQAFKDRAEVEHTGGVQIHLPAKFETAEAWEAADEE